MGVGIRIGGMNTPYLGSLLIAALLGYVVYKNAKERELSSAVGWGVLTFFFGLISVAAYYFAVLRPNKKG